MHRCQNLSVHGCQRRHRVQQEQILPLHLREPQQVFQELLPNRSHCETWYLHFESFHTHFRRRHWRSKLAQESWAKLRDRYTESHLTKQGIAQTDRNRLDPSNPMAPDSAPRNPSPPSKDRPSTFAPHLRTYNHRKKEPKYKSDTIPAPARLNQTRRAWPRAREIGPMRFRRVDAPAFLRSQSSCFRRSV